MMGPLGDPVPSQVEWKCITPLIPHSILRPIGWRHRPGQSDLPEVDPKLVTCEEVVPRGAIHSHAEEIPSQSIPTALIGATALESHTYPVSSNLIGRESRGIDILEEETIGAEPTMIVHRILSDFEVP